MEEILAKTIEEIRSMDARIVAVLHDGAKLESSDEIRVLYKKNDGRFGFRSIVEGDSAYCPDVAHFTTFKDMMQGVAEDFGQCFDFFEG